MDLLCTGKEENRTFQTQRRARGIYLQHYMALSVPNLLPLYLRTLDSIMI